MGVGRDHLHALYADTSDPWDFAHSDYEQAKFAATRAALSRPRYTSAFELGCGNGQLARHLVEICDRYTGMDAVAIAIEAARQAVPNARFIHDFYPCPLSLRSRASLIARLRDLRTVALAKVRPSSTILSAFCFSSSNVCCASARASFCCSARHCDGGTCRRFAGTGSPLRFASRRASASRTPRVIPRSVNASPARS
ncbi:methyltransferase domain-containing protein [Roseovarius sp. M141]|nr:methyltransferase domain-containing protein [Roseovarius sp. M141]